MLGPMTGPDPIYIRLANAQAVFGLHRSTIYRLAKQGEIRVRKRGGASFVSVAELTAYIGGGDDPLRDQIGDSTERQTRSLINIKS